MRILTVIHWTTGAIVLPSSNSLTTSNFTDQLSLVEVEHNKQNPEDKATFSKLFGGDELNVLMQWITNNNKLVKAPKLHIAILCTTIPLQPIEKSVFIGYGM